MICFPQQKPIVLIRFLLVPKPDERETGFHFFQSQAVAKSWDSSDFLSEAGSLCRVVKKCL